MIKIKGQERVTNELYSCTLDTLSHTVLLCGEEGSGKHSICGSLSELLSIYKEELTKDKITFDYLCDIESRPYVGMYIINLDDCTEKEQNVILKFIEEPSIYTYVFLLCENSSTVLPTILGRCKIYKMDLYTEDILLEFTEDKDIIKYFNTPGKIIKYKDNVSDIIALCKNIDKNIGGAAIGNIFTITEKVPKVYPADLFIKILLNTVSDIESYKRTLKASKDLKFTVDKKWYLENFLIELKFIKKKNDIRRA